MRCTRKLATWTLVSKVVPDNREEEKERICGYGFVVRKDNIL